MMGGLEEQPCNTGTILRRQVQIKYLQVRYWHTVTTWEVVQRGVGNRGGHPHAPCLVQMENVPRRPT